VGARPGVHTLLVLVILFLLARPVVAQVAQEGLELRLTRDWGYGGGFQIQGRFSLHASGPESLVQVDFLVDGQVVYTDDEPPFRFTFHTSEYIPGVHTLSAVGILLDGNRLQGRVIRRQFLSAEEARTATLRLVVPLLIGVGVLSLLGFAFPMLFSRRREHRPGVYGAAGGAVCPRCGFPFTRGFFSPNLLAGKLERCPHCGKWAVVRRASHAELEAAEARLAQSHAQEEALAPEKEEEHYRKLIDESRFEG
jgi:hypothetical protein